MELALVPRVLMLHAVAWDYSAYNQYMVLLTTVLVTLGVPTYATKHIVI